MNPRASAFHIRITIIVALTLACAMTLPAFGQANLGDYQLVAANGLLGLYINMETTEIAVQHIETGEIWYSSPSSNRYERDVLSIVYFNPSDDQKTMDSFNDSVAYQQFEIETIDNGVRVRYLFGPEWFDTDWLPIMVPQDRFENVILPRVPEERRQWLTSKYKLVALQKLGPDEESVIPELDRYFEGYTVVSPGKTLSTKDKTTLTYLLMDAVVTGNPDKLTGRSDIRLEHVKQLIDTPAYILDNAIRPWDRTDIIKLMKEIDYTPHEIGKDHVANNINPPVANVEVFRITVEYTLDEDALVVRIPVDEIYYPVQVEPNDRYITGVASFFRPTSRTELFDYFGPIGGRLVDFPLHSVSVLAHFGAAHVDSEGEGYIFLPDGSGALVDTSAATNLLYSQDIFGSDHSAVYGLGGHEYVKPRDRFEREDVYMPVFGLKEGNKAFLAIIEEGQGMARVKANTASSVSPYAQVSSEYVLIPYGEIRLTETDKTEELAGKATGQIKSFAKQLPAEDIAIRYVFLVGDNATYAGMANAYRDYLVEKYDLQKTSESSQDIPFYLELIGAIPVKRSIMGIPRNVIVPLTTYREAMEIVDQLMNRGISNVQVRYKGWREGGLLPGFPNKVELEKALGAKADFAALVDYLDSRGVGLYPDVDFLNVYQNKYGKFNLRYDIAQSLNRQPVWMIRDNLEQPAYVVAPSRLSHLLLRFLADYRMLNVRGISLGDLGKQVNSDFSLEQPVSRADSLVLMENAIGNLKSEGQDILVNKANIYCLPYATHMVNLPLTANNYNIVARSVPFYQMVLHGYVHYTSEPLNHYPDYNYAVLKFLEVGAAPYFSWMYEQGTTVKQTDFDFLFPNYYQSWLDRAVDAYFELNSVLAQVSNQCIIDHRKLDENVFMTSYENGISVIVNYNDADYNYNGTVVAGRGYAVVGE